MPTYEISDPSGNKYHVDAPAGATEQDALSYVRDNHDSLKSLKVQESAAPPPGRIERVGIGMRDIVGGAAQGLEHLFPKTVGDINKANNWLVDKGVPLTRVPDGGIDTMERQRAADLRAQGVPDDDLYRVGGQIAATLPLNRFGPMLAGAATGALSPAVGDKSFADEKLQQITTGAALGQGTKIAGNALAKMIAPSADVAMNALRDAGVTLTPGQMGGPFSKRTEEAMKSLPFTGNVVRDAESRALDSFNVKTAQKALEPIGIELKADTGRAAIKQGQEALSSAYDKVLDKVKIFGTDDGLAADIGNLRKMAEELPPGVRDQFESILKNRVAERFGPNGTMDGKTLKQVESELSYRARNLKSSQDSGQRQLGYAVDEVRNSIRASLARQYPEAAKELQQVNAAYSRFATVERAASRRATSEGRFTPGDLLQAIKQEDISPRDRQFAAGDRPFQDWAEGAYKVMGNKLPDSGTAERWAHSNLAALATGLAALPLSVLHTKSGMEFLSDASKALPATRNYLSKMVQQNVPYTAPAATVIDIPLMRDQ